MHKTKNVNFSYISFSLRVDLSVTDVVQNWFDRESTDEQGICNFLCSHN